MRFTLKSYQQIYELLLIRLAFPQEKTKLPSANNSNTKSLEHNC